MSSTPSQTCWPKWDRLRVRESFCYCTTITWTIMSWSPLTSSSESRECRCVLWMVCCQVQKRFPPSSHTLLLLSNAVLERDPKKPFNSLTQVLSKSAQIPPKDHLHCDVSFNTHWKTNLFFPLSFNPIYCFHLDFCCSQQCTKIDLF